MKILIYVNTIQNLNNRNLLGGIEILNFYLYKFLKNKNKTLLTNKLTSSIKNKHWDIVISSNDSIIFNHLITKKKILWLHNKLQVEKAFRKKQLFPILSNKPYAIFVSKFLYEKTSKIYPFRKRYIIKNFLDKSFENIKINYQRKPIFTWSVQRSKGLKEVLKLWKNKIYKTRPDAKLYIFGIKKVENHREFKKFNIFFLGKVKKNILIKYYKISMGMICLGYDETFCLNAIESMSCGQPILSFGKTALNELIKNNINGYRVKNFDKLCKKIIDILDLKKLKRDKIINTTYKYSKKYYFEKVKSDWLKITKL
tara:strand:- start:933 stop:1868 length:936 start_codon:yes stop_codon:yes gene_type:complete